jgi:hypothetical protein
MQQALDPSVLLTGILTTHMFSGGVNINIINICHVKVDPEAV